MGATDAAKCVTASMLCAAGATSASCAVITEQHWLGLCAGLSGQLRAQHSRACASLMAARQEATLPPESSTIASARTINRRIGSEANPPSGMEQGGVLRGTSINHPSGLLVAKPIPKKILREERNGVSTEPQDRGVAHKSRRLHAGERAPE